MAIDNTILTPDKQPGKGQHLAPAKAPVRASRPKGLMGPFGKINYICMAACLAMIILGFILMGGSGSSVEVGFNPDIFSTRRIVVGPTITFLGFLLMAFAIIIKPRSEKEKPAAPDTPESQTL